MLFNVNILICVFSYVCLTSIHLLSWFVQNARNVMGSSLSINILHFKTKDKSNEVSYFQFLKYDRCRKMWIDNCKRKEYFNPNTLYLCLDHITEVNLKKYIHIWAKIIGGISTKNFNKFAIPSSIYTLKKNPSKPTEKRKDYEKRTERKYRRFVQQFILENDKYCEHYEAVITKNREPNEFDCKLEYLKRKVVFFKNYNWKGISKIEN